MFFYKINDSIRNKIKIAELYTSKDPAREFMQGVFFDKEGKIVATDGRIMYVTNGIPEFPVCQIKVTKILLKILDIADYIEMGIKYANSKNKETNQEVRVAKYIIFNFKIGTSEFTYSCKLIEGKFPNWKAVIPEKQDFHVVPFDKKIWKDIYSASKKLQPRYDKNLYFTIEDSNHVTISNDDIVYATIEWSIEPDINKRNVLVFNADYLNILLTKSGELIDIGYTNFLRAFTFTYKDGSIAVAMPTQIKE
ncbi:MAG: DNA polymerase III subunit beta [Candidatus Methanofastidiosum methylothiophilum]|uniref:DNA polymerase III subunit beta n=1 Tax=Candidatus Methanofastidiosum methylothiophilum TaxID=1705564 RepID=A0A150JER5_9EURY|nr:MAG: DNA polymerase III subunit beta [Candidatus Methanofastidiosum methylthiophilus]